MEDEFHFLLECPLYHVWNRIIGKDWICQKLLNLWKQNSWFQWLSQLCDISWFQWLSKLCDICDTPVSEVQEIVKVSRLTTKVYYYIKQARLLVMTNNLHATFDACKWKRSPIINLTSVITMNGLMCHVCKAIYPRWFLE